jgi:hypothetical protein
MGCLLLDDHIFDRQVSLRDAQNIRGIRRSIQCTRRVLHRCSGDRHLRIRRKREGGREQERGTERERGTEMSLRLLRAGVDRALTST